MADAQVRSSVIVPWLSVLRGFAALAVVMVHTGQQFSSDPMIGRLQPVTDLGKHGVAVFFVLSAYLLTPQLTAVGRTTSELRGYIIRRFWRIAPAYYVCLLLLVILHRYPLSDLLSHLLFIFNFSDRSFGAINYPFWSIAVEVSFYVLLPLLIWTIDMQKRVRLCAALMVISVIWQAGSGIARQLGSFDITLDWSARLYLLSAIPAFLLGMLASSGELERSSRALSAVRIAAGAAMLDVAVRALIIVGLPLTSLSSNLDNAMHGSIGYLAYGSLGVLFIRGAEQPGWRDRVSHRYPFLVSVGNASFSLYLWHLPVLTFVAVRQTPALRLLLAYALLAVVVAASYRFIERPGIRVGRLLESGRRGSLT